LTETSYKQLVNDVLSGVSLLQERPNIESSKVGLVGHSQGASIATLSAVTSESVSFVVMLAGPGTTGRLLLLDQAEAILDVSGVPTDRLTTHRMAHAQALDALDKDAATQRSAFKKMVSIQVDIATDLLGQPRPADLNPIVDGALAVVDTLGFRELVAYDPRPTLAALDVPVLALNGSKDLQVLPTPNLEAIRSALGQNDDTTVMEFPGLNHLFQHADKGTMDEYGMIDETVAPEVMETVSAWLLKR
ncbi:MAG: alpha/beta fold hydrolase, partial [Rhodobacterales bacterium]|nr:alpha/beta fold hydrolase [Rhodobacterales bacterium]